MYAQKLEGDSWRGERMDMGKVEKMSGMLCADLLYGLITDHQQINNLVSCMSL